VNELWGIITADLEKFDAFTKIPWNEVKAGDIEDEIRALMKTLSANKIDKKSNV